MRRGRSLLASVVALLGASLVPLLVGPVVTPAAAQTQLSGVTFTGSPQAANAAAAWTVGFTASSTGALAAGSSATVSVGFPAAFGIPTSPTLTFLSGFTGTCPPAQGSTSSDTVTASLPAACALGASTPATVMVTWITDPAAGSYPASGFSVATSADTTVASPSAAVVIGAASPGATYTAETPTLATITNGTSAAPWNAYQGDPGYPAYASQPPGTVLPTFTPGGANGAPGTSTSEPNVAVQPGASSGTDGNSPYPAGTVGSPGPLTGYCGSGNNASASGGSPVRQPNGTTFPISPAYFPHIVRNPDGSLTGYFDWRPKDADEALVAATSTDNGKDWTYDGEALEENPGYCPSADINDDGEGHVNLLTIGGKTFVYTLARAAGDMQGVGMLVHQLNGTGPLAGLPATESVGIDPDAFVPTGTAPISVVTPTATTIPLNTLGTPNSPEQLVVGSFVDLTQTPTPTAPDVITCTGLGTLSLTGCTVATGSLTVNPGDLIEQVFGFTTPSSDIGLVVPSGPNTTNGDGGLASFTIDNALPGGTPDFANPLTGATFNNNAPNRLYLNGTAIYCAQANANPTTHIEDCTTGPNNPPLTISSPLEPITGDPIIPATTDNPSALVTNANGITTGDGMTNGLVAPDGIVGTLPSFPTTGPVPAGATYVMYTEKELSYYVAAETTAKGTFSTKAFSITSTPGPYISEDLPATGPWNVQIGATAPSPSTATAIIPVTCTGLDETTGAFSGCTVSSTYNNWTWASSSYIAAPGASTALNSTPSTIGEGSSSVAKLFKNNEDLEVLRVAYTTDGVSFFDTNLVNNGVISGENNCNTTGNPICTSPGSYDDISNPTEQTSPANLNQYAGNDSANGTAPASGGTDTGGTPDLDEMRWVGSAGSIITNPNGTLGLFLSGAWAGDGDSDAFNQAFYSTSSNGEYWSVPVPIVSTDYSFAASATQDAEAAAGHDEPLGISAYYSGRAYAPSVVQNPNGTLTMLFGGDRVPKSVEAAGTVLGTNPAQQYTVGAADPALIRNILTVQLVSSTSPAVTTTTSLSTSTTTPVVGQQVTYTATVAPVAPGAGTPTGSVTFTGDDGTLCTAPLNESSPDAATCTTTYAAPGSDSVTASYGGDSNYATSNAATPAAVTIGDDVTSTSISATPAALVVGEAVAYTATVSVDTPGAGTPTGTVTFTGNGGAALCSASLNGDTPDEASCVTTYAASGTDDVTASYGGDTNDATSSSGPPLPVPIGAATTSTDVTSSDSTPVVGEKVTFTATVTPAAPGSGVPTGTVTFAGDAGTLCATTLNEAVDDTASCTTTYTAPGTDTVSATYTTDGNYLGSVGSVGETIGAAATTTGVVSSPVSPVVGQQVTYTATVAPVAPGAGTPAGTVTFYENGSAFCSPPATLNGESPDTATCTTTYASTAKPTVTAVYAGSSDFSTSTSPPLNESIAPAKTATSITVSPANPTVGQIVTYSAVVSASAPGVSAPTGTVTFNGSGGALCSGTLSAASPYTATCQASYPAVGSDSVTASYGGDPDDLASTSGPSPVTITPDGTTTGLASSDASPEVGESVTFTATVSANSPGAGTPTGHVTFTEGSTTLCTTALDLQTPDQATCTASFPDVGSASVSATYAGDANFTTSQSGSTVEAVSQAQTTTVLSANVSSSVTGETVTFTAEVNTVEPGGGTPGGTVVFTQKDGRANKTTALCTSSLSDTTPDTATCVVSYATVGDRTVTAGYAGTASYAASVSDAYEIAVAAAGTTTTLTATPAPSVTGEGVTFTATVSADAPSTATPTGRVVFNISGVGDSRGIACHGGNTQPLANAVATCTVNGTNLLATRSPLQVIAGYEGSSAFQPSATTAEQVVTPDATTVTVSSSAYPSAPGQAVSFTASVSAAAPGSGTPKGTMTFSFSTLSLVCAGGDTVDLGGRGSATCRIGRRMILAPVTVTATYSGSANYDESVGSFAQKVS